MINAQILIIIIILIYLLKWIYYRQWESKQIYEQFKIIGGATSSTYKVKNIFIKFVTKYIDYNVYEREKYLSTILHKFNWYPKLLYYNDKKKLLIFEYVGIPLTAKNAPNNVFSQFNNILKDLASVNIQHNDIKKGELLINNNKLYLCDFGWASINNDLSCGINIWKGNKPYGVLKDSSALKRIGIIYNLSELHIIIDWTNHFDSLEKKILYPLELLKKDKIKKLRNKAKIMSKFYKVFVNDYRGETNFTIYIIKDHNPFYDFRNTTKGRRKVNAHIFDLKTHLRSITGGSKIHGTDNIQETKENLKVLNLFNKYYIQKSFTNLQHVIKELNKYPELEWVVMRNFEKMPNNLTIDEHLDIDLLVNDYYLVKRILDGFSATQNTYEDGKNRILNYVIINNKKVLFDFRSIGDNYYDKKFQLDILKTRIKDKNGLYIPNSEYHLYSLIYHAIIHKSKISKTYIDVFKKYGLNKSQINKKTLKQKLDIFMKKNNYQYVKPEISVGFFI